jgi:hypothetical protein
MDIPTYYHNFHNLTCLSKISRRLACNKITVPHSFEDCSVCDSSSWRVLITVCNYDRLVTIPHQFWDYYGEIT